MHKDRPELGLFLAEQALKAKYQDSAAEIKERAEIKEYCLENLSSANAKKFYLRLQKMEINRIIVDTILKELPAEKRAFVELKYKNNETFVNISMRLNVSMAQLNIWNKAILNEIKNFLFYTLTEKDIFSRIKIINMIHIIDIRVEFFEKHRSEGSDTNLNFVNERWLNSLIALRSKYRQLLITLDNCMAKKSETIGNHIIATKLEHPIENPSELAARCHISVTAVSRYLKQFTHNVKKYIS